MRSVAEAEEGLNAPAVALLVNAVPALPVLVAGFIGQEGREIVSWGRRARRGSVRGVIREQGRVQPVAWLAVKSYPGPGRLGR